MDLANVTFIGLMTVGVINVFTFFYPEADSKAKFALSLAVAFGLTFVPPEIGSVILEKAKQALEVAFAASGTYKLAQKVGGN